MRCLGNRKKVILTILTLIVLFALLYGTAYAAGDDAISKASKSAKEILSGIVALVVLVIGMIELARRQISAAISLVLAAVLIYAATNTNLLDVVGTSIAAWFGATPTK